MNTDYKTVKIESSDEFTEKRSRFIGYVKPVKTEAEAVEFINSIRSKHWDARHNVYAYSLREGNIKWVFTPLLHYFISIFCIATIIV